jgi:serine acetyltransferase/GT2 family glycosyltransferase
MSVDPSLIKPVLPVSVIIPAYNAGETIERALRSVLNQPTGSQPAEILVVDDHSIDRTAQIAEDVGVRVIRHATNQGAAAARNTAMHAATQPWLALLDADDEWLSNWLSALWPLRDQHVLVSGACVAHDENRPGQVGEYAGMMESVPRVLRSPGALIPQNLVMASATLVRRDVAIEAGGFDTSLRYAEDWDLWLRVLERGTGLLSPEVVALYHLHGGQKSQHLIGPADAHRRIVAGCVGRDWWTSEIAERWDSLQWWMGLKESIRARQWQQASGLLVQLTVHPSRIRDIAARRGVVRAWKERTAELTRDVQEDRPSALATRLAKDEGSVAAGPSVSPGFREWLLQDWEVNEGLYWVQIFLVWFRMAQWAQDHLGRWAKLIITPYWLTTSLVLSVEFPATVTIGPRLQIFHLHGIVLHPQSQMGSDCILRHGVTIGNRIRRDGEETGAASLGNGVDLGAGCAILGDIHIGDRARIGALAVVLEPVPAGGIAVGNPARVVRVDSPA